MTIDNVEIIRELLEHDGRYEDDPQAWSIWSYLNRYGGATQAVYYALYELQESAYIKEPMLLWTREGGLTEAGKAWLDMVAR